ncbi:MAG TPA: cytochrome c [Chthoniobacterales bacterium]|jgi:mono/diheme cytochrome c family protein|nr:cytochrome c [Chthoniobacterales bacterium]
MSSHEEHSETPELNDAATRTRGHGSEAAISDPAVPAVGDGAVPRWLIGLMLFGLFWSGAYLFSYSGGFSADVFDYLPKFGPLNSGPQAAPDPKVIGKALFSANCITCHQATGQGLPGQYPPLAGSEIVLGDASNRLIAIVLKGLQGPATVKGQSFNNSMQAWEGQYTDAQLSAILTYVRSDWGNNAPPVPPEAVKQMRDELKDRKEQWTFAEVMKLPGKDVAKAGGSEQQAANKPAPGASPAASASPAAQPK